MRLISRTKLKKLMIVNNTSQRQLATAAGYRSHTRINRLLQGQIDTLPVEAATRIARYLGVQVSDIFVPRESSTAKRSVQRTNGSAA